MLRSLKNVEVLPDDQARALLREGLNEQESLALDSAVSETEDLPLKDDDAFPTRP